MLTHPETALMLLAVSTSVRQITDTSDVQAVSNRGPPNPVQLDMWVQ